MKFSEAWYLIKTGLVKFNNKNNKKKIKKKNPNLFT
jgi:hypothetical protein